MVDSGERTEVSQHPGQGERHPGDLLAPTLPGGEPIEKLLRGAQFFAPGKPSPDHREVHRKGGREAEEFWHERWRHDKVVRSTHGVNCTGSCSWKVYVKDGIITWETQQTDYPSVGPDSPEYEPRGCPRGASFSWYTYSPSRVRYPYVRGPLLDIWREARQRLGDPVAAWEEITADPERTARYKQARGKGGFVRASWPEVTELVAAAHVATTKNYGPDRVVGFSPIPAMSQVSYSAGTRFLSMIGGTILSFYDWYADMPIASPQVFGDQTDVPESGDWWNSSYLVIWGTNLPITRTPDAHFMVEARYRGQKVVVVSPDFADHTKFADDWLPAAPGTDGALAMAMGHVILTEFFRDRQVPYFTDYVKKYTDLPFLVTLRERGDGYVADRFLTAADLGGDAARAEGAAHKTVLLDSATGAPHVPNGSIGFRWTPSGQGRWNLDLKGVDPVLSLYGRHEEAVPVDLAALRHRRDRGRRDRPPRGPGGARRRPAGHHRLRPADGAVRRAARWTARRVAQRLRRRLHAVHPGLAGADHLGAGRGRGPRRPRVRPQRRGFEGPLDDRDGRGHQPLVPLRPDLPQLLHPAPAVRLRGCQRWRLGALRRPGEGAPAHRLPEPRLRAGLAAAHPAHDRDLVLLPAQRPVALRELRRRRAGQPLGKRHVPRPHLRRLPSPGRPARLDPLAPGVRQEPAGHCRRGGRRRASRWPSTWWRSCGPGGCGSPTRTRTIRPTFLG